MLGVALSTDQHSCNAGKSVNIFAKPNRTSM